MAELGTAWVTLAVSTQNMERDIKRAFENVEKSAKLSPDVDAAKMSGKASRAGRSFGDLFGRSAKAAPDVDTSRLSSKATSAGQEFGSRFSAGAKAGLAALGAAGLASTLVDQFKKVMSVGMDFTTSLNTLQSVSGATAAEMEAVSAAARQLGTDVALPGTSATDAAAAMTELAKGGFSVQQSMEAARGSLQLAAAAGVSASEAATIQSTALQAFGLGADQAGKVADTLANAANASSAEITDVAAALQQAGTVANQFGLTAEDTAASIGLLANSGIKGSDAGTLLKSALLALTDQGNPAQGAIKALGLTVYDAQGKFVGMSKLLGQLGEASKKMTPEQYQAATATLFGSDAMRLAGVAAKDGAESYDQMRVAIDRQGAAADVAGARMKGLPGAWARVKGALEDVQLQAYGLVEGPLVKVADMVTSGLNGLGSAGDNSAFKSITEAVNAAAPGMKDIAVSLGKAAGAIGVGAWKAFTAALEAAAGVLKVLAPLLNSIGTFMRENQGLVTAFVGAFAGFKLLPGVLSRVSSAFQPFSAAIGNIIPKTRELSGGVKNVGDSWKTMAGYFRQANPEMSKAQANMAVLKSNASALASGGLNAVKGAASGLSAALGGPLNIALMGATVAFGVIATKNAEATAAAEGYAQATKNSAEAQVGLNDALIRSAGLMDEAAKAEASKKIQAAKGELDAGSKSSASFLDDFRDESGSLLGGITGDWGRGTLGEQKDETARVAGEASRAIDNLKLSQEALDAQIVGGQPGFDALVGALEKQGEGGAVAAAKLGEVRAQILGAQQAGATVAPVLAKLGDDAAQSAANIRTALSAVPTNVPVNITAPGGQATYDLLKQLDVAVETNNDKNIVVTAPMAPEVTAALETLGYLVTVNNDKTISVSQVGAEDAGAAIDQAARDRQATINVLVNTQAAAVDAGAALGAGVDPSQIPKRADGAIVPMANGGLRMIEKPDQADIYDGQGAGTIFAEEETGGEAYIPLAPAKRGRSTKILAEVARLFGLSLSAPTGSTGSSVSSSPDLVGSLGSEVGSPIVNALGDISNTIGEGNESQSSTVLRAQSVVTSAQARLEAAVNAVNALAAKGSDTSVAEKRREAAEQSLAAAEQRLDEAKGKESTKASNSGDMDGSSLGQSIVGGMLQSIGLDGSLFSNPFEMPNVKSAMALVNYGGGLLKGFLGAGQEGQSEEGGLATDVAGGALGGIGLPNIADFLKPLPNGAMQPQAAPDAPHQGGGQPAGPSVVVNGNIGMNPRDFTQRVDSAQNQAVRRNLSAVRPQ